MDNNELLVTQELIDQVQSAMQVRKVNQSYLANYNDNIILVDTSLANLTVTLPLAKNGKEFIIVKGSASNGLTVQFSGADKMFGLGNISMLELGTRRLKSIPGGYIPL
jgi:hypothetical protein